MYTTKFLLILVCFNNVQVSLLRKRRHLCSEVPLKVLENTLGGAFNARYMSVEKPPVVDPSTANKRTATFGEEFYVDEDFVEQVDIKPAWEVSNHVAVSQKRYGVVRDRRGVDYLQEWHCKSRIEWTDLGPEYFPRYLRSVVCLSEKCWFGIYKCKPRAFAVKLLKRKKDLCTSERGQNFQEFGGKSAMTDLWVWEERTVNFCCDCTRD